MSQLNKLYIKKMFFLYLDPDIDTTQCDKESESDESSMYGTILHKWRRRFNKFELFLKVNCKY